MSLPLMSFHNSWNEVIVVVTEECKTHNIALVDVGFTLLFHDFLLEK